MSDFWNDEEQQDFRDIPDEVAGQEAPPAQTRVPRPTAPVQPQPAQKQNLPGAMRMWEDAEAEVAAEAAEEEEDFSSVLNEARFKLELGRLYEMLMNHNIFDGADADDKAIKYVTKQIRNFCKQQMEIMLGMRQEETKSALAATDFPFNDLEVQTLKALAATATKGASAAPEAQSFTVGQSRQQTSIRPLGVNQVRPQRRTAPAPPPIQQKPLQKQPAAPVKRITPQIEQILREEGVTMDEIDQTFRPNYKPLDKSPVQMTEQEIIARNKRANAGKQVSSSAAIPMPTPEQEEMIHTSRAQAAASHPQMQSIMKLLTVASTVKK